MSKYRNHVRLDHLASATRALSKFRREHGYSKSGLKHVDACAAALEAEDFTKALEHFRAIPFGGMGTFNDFVPEVSYPHEDPSYVWMVDLALTERWCRLMHTAAGDAV